MQDLYYTFSIIDNRVVFSNLHISISTSNGFNLRSSLLGCTIFDHENVKHALENVLYFLSTVQEGL